MDLQTRYSIVVEVFGFIKISYWLVSAYAHNSYLEARVR